MFLTFLFSFVYIQISNENPVSFVGVSFINIDIMNAAIYDNSYQSQVRLIDSEINIINGAFYYSEHLFSTTINISNISLTSYELEADDIFEGIFVLSATDVTYITSMDVLYSYNISQSCEYQESYDLANDLQFDGKFDHIVCKNPMTLIQNYGELNLNDITIDLMPHSFESLSSYLTSDYTLFEYETSSRCLLKNIGSMNIEKLSINRTISYAFIINEGALSVIDLSFTPSFIQNYNPNSLHSSRIITQIGSESFSSIKKSSFIGSYYSISVTGGSVEIINTEFERSNLPLNIKNVDPLTVTNCTFVNIGVYYGSIPFESIDVAGITIISSNDVTFSYNTIMGFEQYGFLSLSDCTNASIIDNIINIDITNPFYNVSSSLLTVYDLVYIDLCENTKMIGNLFIDDNRIKLGACIKYDDNIGFNCLSGNSFINWGLAVSNSDITSCLRPNMIQCANSTDNQCVNQINGFIDESLLDRTGYFIMDDYDDSNIFISYILDARDDSKIVLDNIQILSSSKSDDENARAIIWGISSKVLLIDIVMNIDTHYPNYAPIIFTNILSGFTNDTKFATAILFDIGSFDSGFIWKNTSQSLQSNYVDNSQPAKLYFNSNSTSYYPGEALKFEWYITDKFGKKINITDNTVRIQLNGDTFSSEVIIDETGQCLLCETGVLINEISINQDVGAIYDVNIEVIDNVLILDEDIISLDITGCPIGYGSDANNFTCSVCDTDFYNLNEDNVDKCKSCDIDKNPSIICIQGNILISHDNWMGINKKNNDEIISASCVNGYCCTKDICNYIDDKQELCALNRDPESLLCGNCKSGYSESMNSTKCVKCDKNTYWEYLALPLIVALLFSIFLMATNTDPVRMQSMKEIQDDKKKPFIHMLKSHYFKLFIQTLVLKNILYFEQGVNQILATSSYQVLFNTLASIFNLSLTSIANNEDQDESKLWCFINGLDGKGKILVDLFMPITIPVFLFIFCLISFKKPFIFGNKRVNFEKTFIAMYLIIIGKILDILFKLLSCQQIGNLTVHFYFPSEECYGTSWILALLSLLFVIITFGLIFVRLRFMTDSDRQSKTLHLHSIISRYKPQFYYWEGVIFIRRIIIAVFAVSVSDIISKFIFMAIIMIFIQLQNVYNPFLVHAGNRMEQILLLFLLFIISTQIASDAMDYTFLNVVISLLIIIPLPLLLYFIYTLYKRQVDKIEKEKNEDIIHDNNDINNKESNSTNDGGTVEMLVTTSMDMVLSDTANVDDDDML